jgi:hypothetical protein
LDGYRSFAGQLLIALDGTRYLSSKKLHCPQCNQRKLANGQTQDVHSVLTAVLVQAGNPHVLALEPEFVVPQNGHEKPDCETQAAKRWLAQHGAFYAQRGATILGDDLYCHQPVCQALRALGLHFILTCKAESHSQLHTTADFLAAKGLLGQTSARAAPSFKTWKPSCALCPLPTGTPSGPLCLTASNSTPVAWMALTLA